MLKIPQIPYPVEITVIDSNGSTAVSDAQVTIYDKDSGDNGDKVSTNDGDSNGKYLLDMANMAQDYSQGDTITVEAVSGNKIAQTRTTISGDEQSVSLTLEYNDVLGVIIDLLDDNWDKSTTDNIKPNIARSFEFKEFDLNNFDSIVVYEISETDEPFGLGGTRFKEITGISVDVRTTFKTAVISDIRSHLFKIREEVKRITKANLESPARPFQLLIPRTVRDLSNKSTGMGRVVMDFDCKIFGVS